MNSTLRTVPILSACVLTTFTLAHCLSIAPTDPAADSAALATDGGSAAPGSSGASGGSASGGNTSGSSSGDSGGPVTSSSGSRTGGVTTVPLGAACAQATNIVASGFTANGVVSGTIPAGAKMQLRYGPSSLQGPWVGSPQVAAAAGTFSYAFSNVPPGSYVVRVDVVNAAGDAALLTSSTDCPLTVVAGGGGGGGTARSWQDELALGVNQCSDVVPSNQCQGTWGVAVPSIPGCASGKGPNSSYVANGAAGTGPSSCNSVECEQGQIFGASGATSYNQWLWIQTEYKNGAVVTNAPGSYRVQFAKPELDVKVDSLASPWVKTNPEAPFVANVNTNGSAQYQCPCSGPGTNGGILMSCGDTNSGAWRNDRAIAGNPRNEPTGMSLQVGHDQKYLQYEHDFAGNLPAVGNRIVAAVGIAWARVIPEVSGAEVPAGLSLSAVLSWDGYGPGYCAQIGGRAGTPGQGRQVALSTQWTPITVAFVRATNSASGGMLAGAALTAWLQANQPSFAPPP
jgi:hypothetical protein